MIAPNKELTVLQLELSKRGCMASIEPVCPMGHRLCIELLNGTGLFIRTGRGPGRTNCHGYVTIWQTQYYLTGRIQHHGAPRPVMRTYTAMTTLMADLELLGAIGEQR